MAVVRPAAAVLLALTLAGCTAVPAQTSAPTSATTGAPSAPAAAAVVEHDSDTGNGRPQVSYDGLMVRRRVVVAVHPTDGADPVPLHAALVAAGGSLGLILTDVSPDVLDAVILEHLVPEVLVALPLGSTEEDAWGLVDAASGAAPEGADHFHVASVLVHELEFAVPAADPGALAAAVAREGILSDALGNYSTVVEGPELCFDYIGPLLSDELVETVRAGVARSAHVRPAAVSVAPISAAGSGVDMATEPAPEVVAPHEEEEESGHDH